MILAALDDTGYDLVLLLHFAAVVVTFAPVVMNPLLERHLAANGGDASLQTWAGFARSYTMKISMSGLVVLLVTGVLLILQSGDAWEFSQAWISVAFLVWFAIAGVLSGMTGKGQRLIASGDMKGRELLDKAGPIVIVLLLVMLYLMIFKPGA